MKVKFKRYLAIIPAVFVLLLSCVPMLGAHADDVDMDSYLHDPDSIPGLTEFCDLDNIQSVISSHSSSNYLNHPFYFFGVSLFERFYYDGRSYPFGLFYYQFDSDIPLYEDERYIVYSVSSGFSFNLDSASSSSNYFTYSPDDSSILLYDKTTGQFDYSSQHSSTFDPSVDINFINGRRHIYYQDSNLTDFPFYDGVFHPSSNNLNVSVRIEPELNDSVDTRTMWDGSRQDNAIIRYYVVNNGRQNVAYSFYIVDRGFDVLSVVNSNPFTERISNSVKFVHLSEEFQTALTSGTSYTLAKGKSRWRIQRAQSNGGKFIAWGQMNLLKNTQYDVVVLAYSTPFTYIGGKEHESHIFDDFFPDLLRFYWCSCINLYLLY